MAKGGDCKLSTNKCTNNKIKGNLNIYQWFQVLSYGTLAEFMLYIMVSYPSE